jgi:hypothetical protein
VFRIALGKCHQHANAPRSFGLLRLRDDRLVSALGYWANVGPTPGFRAQHPVDRLSRIPVSRRTAAFPRTPCGPWSPGAKIAPWRATLSGPGVALGLHPAVPDQGEFVFIRTKVADRRKPARSPARLALSSSEFVEMQKLLETNYNVQPSLPAKEYKPWQFKPGNTLGGRPVG